MSQPDMTRAESLDEQDPHRRENDGEKKPKNRRPASAYPRVFPFEESMTLFTDSANLSRHCFSAAASQGMAVSTSSLEAYRRC